MEELRPGPEQLLREIQDEERANATGKLKIFFGYAAGVGKTFAMLEAARVAKQKGIDVVCGYIEPHPRPKTQALVEGLECLPYLEIENNGIVLREFDLDKALERRPELILVDELAHTNATGLRHNKRYQDIKELLNAGIDVYTTVNVQHIESLNDQVAAITGILVRERIPDSVFDEASQVELVDIEPADLINRLNEGYVYKERQAKSAVQNFFTVENLTALRELALRRQADRVNIITQKTRVRNQGDYYTDEHILVCLSSAPSNAKIIRTAARMASAFHSKFTALYVETAKSKEMRPEDKKRLRENIQLATKLGAKVETVIGEDVPYQIVGFARLQGVSKIVLGRSSVRKGLFSKPSLTDRIISSAPNLDVYIIPDGSSQNRTVRRLETQMDKLSAKDMVLSIGILGVVTSVGLILSKLGFTESNITSLYILGVLLISVATNHYIYGFVSSLMSVFVFNFFFTEPLYTLHVYDSDYMMTFVVLFVVAMLVSSLTVKLKKTAVQSSIAAHRTKIMFETNQLLQQAGSTQEILRATALQLNKLLDRSVIIYGANKDQLMEPEVYSVEYRDVSEECISVNEQAVANWVYKNRKQAGASTDTLADARCRYLAIRTNQMVYGVVAIVMTDEALDSFQDSILLSVLGESALALENKESLEERKRATIIAENEKLRSNLLRGISHDLRTPLTAISGNASNLIMNYKQFDEVTIKGLFADIYDDSMWLINLVENLLAVTRFDEEKPRLNKSTELVEDIVEEALKHTNRITKKHSIHMDLSDELIFVNVDVKLIVQVLINLLDNACKYTQEDSRIYILAVKKADSVYISIADNGPGISDDMKDKVFERFFSGNNRLADSRRSLGLGLSLCQTIVHAHGGEIWVTDNKPQGAVFTFTLPIQEVDI